MKDLSNQFSNLYEPHKALLIYNLTKGGSSNDFAPVYVESYDIAPNGKPINAHPLSLHESIALAELLQSRSELQNEFLRSKSLFPPNVLYVNPDNAGYAVWYTPPQKREMLFVENLGIGSAKTGVPAMIWKAGRDQLYVYAIKGKSKPTAKTQLYHAPFFNMYPDHNVCMGNVKINIDRHTCLERFILQWEQYFFGSYFSHTIAGGSIVKEDIVELWKQQVTTHDKFPKDVLASCGLTLSQIIR